MKVSKKKVQAALAKRISEREAEMRREYAKRLQKDLKWAEENLESHAAELAHKKDKVKKAKAAIIAFNNSEEVPSDFAKRYAFTGSEQDRIQRLQLKLEYSQDETINVTDSELALL